MQETNENSSSPRLNASSVNKLVTQNPMMNTPPMFASYHQQVHHFVQNQLTNECFTQNLVQERGAMCINFIEEVMMKNRELEIRNRKLEISLTNALAEADYWRKSSNDKTFVCNNLASRLFVFRTKELAKKRAAEEKEFEAVGESSSGDNGDDDVDTASSSKCKRRRHV